MYFALITDKHTYDTAQEAAEAFGASIKHKLRVLQEPTGKFYLGTIFPETLPVNDFWKMLKGFQMYIYHLNDMPWIRMPR